ncbi:maleate cis-trans isomerase family protein [Futiania mangrovi]|uniref:Aspartate/glutamate racemase family protein n=1 Tax=Futiania mangrovi TaxID=2959716 RepID=A0A9J6P9J6_9PROT|nr:aspartate/glutamate racemase family protein [Futiania mangrovii]MCP1334929.1 aspartate/glutamate racemase family protein [Futiania mangrovii]
MGVAEQTPKGATLMLEHLPYETDKGVAARARLGAVVLATDYTLEHEMREVLAEVPGVAAYNARILNSPTITPETLADMKERIAPTADLILPGDTLDVVMFGCTSGAMVIGEETVFEKIRSVRPEAKPTTPITAAFAAFRAFGAQRIGVLTPYRADVNAGLQRYIEARGFEVPVFGSFNEENDPTVASITVASIEGAIARIVDAADVDGVFVSCTSLRLGRAAAAIEERIGKPVTSSNHAMIWHALRLAGIGDTLPAFGRLYTLPLA